MSLIVADVGGTNARLAFQKNINSEISLIENFLCSDFKYLEDIIKKYKQKHDIFNEHISIGVAGPCEDDDVTLSNNHFNAKCRHFFLTFLNYYHHLPYNLYLYRLFP